MDNSRLAPTPNQPYQPSPQPYQNPIHTQYQQQYQYQQQQQQQQQYYYYQQPQLQPNSLLSSVSQAIQYSAPQTQSQLQQRQPTVYPSPQQFYQLPQNTNYNAYPNSSFNSTPYQRPHSFQQPQNYQQPFPLNQPHLQTTPLYPQNYNHHQSNYINYNQNFNYNANTQNHAQKTNHSRHTEKFPCEQCNQVFYNLTTLSNHLRNHVKCDYENCKFEAIQHILDLHKEDRHLIFKPAAHVPNQSKPKKLDGPPNATIQGLGYALKTQEQIDRWIEERKKKWPTEHRIAEKLALAKEKEEERIKNQALKALARSEHESDAKIDGNKSKFDDQNNKKRKRDNLNTEESSQNNKNRHGKNQKKNSSNSSNLLSFDRSGLFSKLIEKDIDQEVSDIFEIVNFLSSNNFLDGYQTSLSPDEKPSIVEL